MDKKMGCYCSAAGKIDATGSWGWHFCGADCTTAVLLFLWGCCLHHHCSVSVVQSVLLFLWCCLHHHCSVSVVQSALLFLWCCLHHHCSVSVVQSVLLFLWCCLHRRCSTVSVVQIAPPLFYCFCGANCITAVLLHHSKKASVTRKYSVLINRGKRSFIRSSNSHHLVKRAL